MDTFSKRYNKYLINIVLVSIEPIYGRIKIAIIPYGSRNMT